MLTFLIVLVMLLTGLTFVFLNHLRTQRELAERARQQAFLRQQQRHAEQQIRTITQAAFDAMVKEASRPRRLDDYLRR